MHLVGHVAATAGEAVSDDEGEVDIRQIAHVSGWGGCFKAWGAMLST
ncbi:Uncharacterized protein pbN1_35240 [Aromatoleum bremense]|nr:Uncharacterized protein pbN1_35240 [Aromatoleum bremense]